MSVEWVRTTQPAFRSEAVEGLANQLVDALGTEMDFLADLREPLLTVAGESVALAHDLLQPAPEPIRSPLLEALMPFPPRRAPFGVVRRVPLCG